VTVNGRTLDLTPKEFELLECLLRASGRVVTRSQIKEHVWGFTFDAPTKVVDLYVHYLRRKLDGAGAPPVIQTVRGIGYSIGR
jgi:DNA-binding response OmpR family regulator